MKLTQKDFALSFGVSESEIPEKTAILISELDFEIEAIVAKERDNLIIQIIDKIRSDEQEIASPVRKIAWEEGWAENLKLYTNNAKACPSHLLFTPHVILLLYSAKHNFNSSKSKQKL
jgi:hypothetical protein